MLVPGSLDLLAAEHADALNAIRMHLQPSP